MGTYANLALVREGYALWSRDKERAFDHWVGLLAEDVSWRSLGSGAAGMDFTQQRDGRRAVRAYFEGLARDWEMQHYTPEHFIADGDWVVMKGRCAWRHRGTGKVVETPKADFIRFADGSIVEFHEFYDTAAALAATR